MMANAQIVRTTIAAEYKHELRRRMRKPELVLSDVRAPADRFATLAFFPATWRGVSRKGLGRHRVIWRAQAVAMILTAPLGSPELLQAHWTRGALLSILALGAFGTGIAFVLMAAGRVGPTRASATVFLIPGVALLLGVLVRGEHVALLSVIGCAVCVAGAADAARAKQRGPDSCPARAANRALLVTS
jgi:drug/metabolite transporter (DMT)-like permease